jgi:hypothetical protein
LLQFRADYVVQVDDGFIESARGDCSVLMAVSVDHRAFSKPKITSFMQEEIELITKLSLSKLVRDTIVENHLQSLPPKLQNQPTSQHQTN